MLQPGKTNAAPVRVLLDDVEAMAPVMLAEQDIMAHRALTSGPAIPGCAYFSHKLDALIILCSHDDQGHPTRVVPKNHHDDNVSYLTVRTLKTESKRQFRARDWVIGYRDRTDVHGQLQFRSPTTARTDEYRDN